MDRLSMQKVVARFLFVICFFQLALVAPARSETTRSELRRADSLFAIGHYAEAAATYKKKSVTSQKDNPNLLLKLAYISLQSDDYTRGLFYLSKLAEVRPTQQLYQEMEAVAEKYHLAGYEFDDYGYFSILYKRYGHFIHLLLLTLGIYVFVVLIIKIRKGEFIRTRHKWILFFYLSGIMGLITIPDFYSSGIISRDHTYLRSFPSSASPVAARISQGNKVIILTSKDNWYMVIWEKNLVYIRKKDILVI